MNYLAHLFLSGDDESIMVGNLAGDFVKSAELPKLPVGVQRGVQLHRYIDQYTDQHEIVRRSKLRLEPRHGKYSGVIIDIFYDHLLCRHWTKYSQVAFKDFKSRVYIALLHYQAELPRKLQQRIPKMVSHDFLEGYRSLAGMRRVMYFMDQRASFPSYFESSIDELVLHIDGFDQDFQDFFPSLMQYTDRELGLNS